MKIAYQLTPEDIAQFHIFNQLNNPRVKKSIKQRRFLFAALYMLIGVGFYCYNPNYFPGASLFVSFGFLWLVFYPKSFQEKVRRSTYKRLKKAPTENVISEIKMSFEKDGLHVKNHKSSDIIGWHEVTRIEETLRHLFFYLNKSEAVIIPVSAFTEKDSYEKILNFSKQSINCNNF